MIGGTQDWFYEHLGALFWTVELWAPNREAGITDYAWVDRYREHLVDDNLKLLKWSDEQCGGQAHVDWRLFLHPQLGAVEIGGWDKPELLAQPAAAAARARGGALPDVDDARRVEPAQARCCAKPFAAWCSRSTCRSVTMRSHWSAARRASKARNSKATRRRPQAFTPSHAVIADRATAEGLVRAPAGTRVALTARADRAGCVHTEVTLN